MDLEDFFTPERIYNLRDIGTYVLVSLTVFKIVSKVKVTLKDYNSAENKFERFDREMKKRWSEVEQRNKKRYNYIFE